MDSSNIQVSVNVPINDTTGCLRELNQGLHRVRVYDWQDTGRSSQWVFNEVVTIPTEQKGSECSSCEVLCFEKITVGNVSDQFLALPTTQL